MTEATAQYLSRNIGQTLGNFYSKPVLVVPENSFHNTDKKFLCIAETGAVVLNGMVYGHLEYNGYKALVKEVRTPYAYHKVLASNETPKEEVKIEAPEPSVSDPVIADVQLSDQIDATLKGLSLDELLAGFTYGLG